MIFSEMPEVLRYSRHICKLEQNNTLVPEDFLDFSPHERAAREPRSASLLSHAVKTQEQPLGPGYLNETPQNIYIYIWIPTSHPPSHGLYAT